MTLEGFLQYVDTEIKFRVDSAIASHIHQACREIVRLVVDSIAERRPYLSASEITSVGSYAEGTKLCAPDEFDFMVCLDFLSRNVEIEVDTKRVIPGFVFALYISEEVVSDCERQGIIIQEVFGQSNLCCIGSEVLWSTYRDAIEEVMGSFKKKKYVTSKGYFVIKGSKFLSLKLEWHSFRTDYSGPIMGLCVEELKLETLYRLNIDIDIMPALVVDNFSVLTEPQLFGIRSLIKDATNKQKQTVCVLSELHGFPSHVLESLDNPQFHLIGKRSGQPTSNPYIHMSHATSEVTLMKSLHPIHRQCYKVLKYLLTEGIYMNHPHKPMNISSYWFKNAVLYHEYDKLCSGQPHLVKCSTEIIKYIMARLRDMVFPSFLFRFTNIWGHYYKFPAINNWTPEGLPSDICTGEWGLVLWYQLWRQFLAQALILLKKIEQTDDRVLTVNQDRERAGEEDEEVEEKEYGEEVVEDFGEGEEAKEEGGKEAREQEVDKKDVRKEENKEVKEEEKDKKLEEGENGEVRKERKVEKEEEKEQEDIGVVEDDEEGGEEKADGNQINEEGGDDHVNQNQEHTSSAFFDDTSPGRNSCVSLVLYEPNMFDLILDEFETLRLDISTILNEYFKSRFDILDATLITIPLVDANLNENLRQRVLPSFPKYLEKLEEVCRRKFSIPKEDFIEELDFELT